MFKFLALALAFAVAGTPAMAQDFPSKQPIKIVVPFNPGGLADVMARLTADALSRRMGQAVIVENRPGAASAIATAYVSKAPPDGYTLMLATADLAVLPAARRDLTYKFEDFTYLTRITTLGTLLIVGPQSPFNSVADLVAYMKANPGKLSYATPGVASLNHFGTLQFLDAAGASAIHVPYSGAAPIYAALLAGTVDLYNGATQPFHEKLKILAATKRYANLPHVPTLDDLGYKDGTHVAWWGFVAPPNVPKPIADRLIAELRAVLQDPATIAKFKSSTSQVPDENPLAGEAFRQRVLQEHKVWKDLVDSKKVDLGQ
jgi:tripartite-type tricarboxylate transporter receptor subunit TctC